MFERNRVDNRSAIAVAVEITQADGTVLAGRAALPGSKGVHQLLDGTDAFLFIELFEGEPTFVPKAEIKAVRLIQPMRTQSLNLAVADASHFDPYRMLGLARTASAEEIRAAYHRLTKLYHPDRYASVELPPEVKSYLDGMAKQVNAAFRALRSPARASVA